MRKAITTRYLPATSTKGARIKASAEGGNSITLPRDWELDHEEDHVRVAKALAAKLQWQGIYVAGYPDKGTGYVYINAGSPKAADGGDHTKGSLSGSGFGVEGRDWFQVRGQEA